MSMNMIMRQRSKSKSGRGVKGGRGGGQKRRTKRKSKSKSKWNTQLVSSLAGKRRLAYVKSLLIKSKGQQNKMCLVDGSRKKK